MTAEYFLNQILFYDNKLNLKGRDYDINIIKRELRDLPICEVDDYKKRFPKDLIYQASYELALEAASGLRKIIDEKDSEFCQGDCLCN